MKKKVLIFVATVIAVVGSVVGGTVQTASAGLSECSFTRNGNINVKSVCYSLTAGGNQHQRAWIECLIPWYGSYRTYYGATVGVLATSTATAPTGAIGCFGGYQLRP